MPRGYASDKFVTNPEKMEVVYEKPSIYVIDYELKTFREIESLLGQIKDTDGFSKPLIIIARGFDGELFNTMIVNKVKNGVKVCLICAPTQYQREAMRDIACLTGAKLICDEAGLKPEHTMYADAGTCEKIIVSKFSTLILGGNTDLVDLEQIKQEINLEISSTSNEQLKEILEKRLARLSGSIGVIYVGGATEVESKEKKDRVDDAVRAVKSAIEEGVVPGGGLALIRCINELSDIVVRGDEKLGVELVELACLSPLKKMLSNACLPESIADDVLRKKGNEGYNVKTGEFCDLIKSGIIDPVKVVRCSLQNASSVASQVIGSDVLMVEMRPKD
jgi:chaperonin GroEL